MILTLTAKQRFLCLSSLDCFFCNRYNDFLLKIFSELIMFEGLTERLAQVFKELRRRGKLSSADVDIALREVRIALLEADVNYQVVKVFINKIRERAVGTEVSHALNPAQQVIKIVYEELVSILGEPVQFSLKGEKPRMVLLVGLQGSGKTTAAAKLARFLQKQGERVVLAAADPFRPAADLQLFQLAEKINIPVISLKNAKSNQIVNKAIDFATKGNYSVLVIDTAGRSQIDQTLMNELHEIVEDISPNEVLLVVDALTGQEAVKIAQGFNQAVPLTGLFFTKMDGDARGGAAISIRQVTGIPIKWISSGESIDTLEFYNPKRLADRVLGMGDVMGLIEKAEEAFNQQQAGLQVEKLKEGKFTLDDYAEQLHQINKMGSVRQLLEMLPSNLSIQPISSEEAETKLKKNLSIIQSMTMKERRNPDVLNANRRKRIAQGSGNQVQDVNRLINEFNNFQQVLKKFGKLDKRGLHNLVK